MWSSTYLNTARMHVTVRDAARFRSSAPEVVPYRHSPLAGPGTWLVGESHKIFPLSTLKKILSFEVPKKRQINLNKTTLLSPGKRGGARVGRQRKALSGWY